MRPEKLIPGRTWPLNKRGALNQNLGIVSILRRINADPYQICELQLMSHNKSREDLEEKEKVIAHLTKTLALTGSGSRLRVPLLSGSRMKALRAQALRSVAKPRVRF